MLSITVAFSFCSRWRRSQLHVLLLQLPPLASRIRGEPLPSTFSLFVYFLLFSLLLHGGSGRPASFFFGSRSGHRGALRSLIFWKSIVFVVFWCSVFPVCPHCFHYPRPAFAFFDFPMRTEPFSFCLDAVLFTYHCIFATGKNGVADDSVDLARFQGVLPLAFIDFLPL